MRTIFNKKMREKRGEIGASIGVIIALILLLVGLAIAYMFITGSVDPLLNSKLGSLFEKAQFG